MNLQKLERMLATYDAGSFRKAAKTLGIALPTLTWSIQQLEESLNARLFERGPRGIRPTDLCERLVRRARLILREQERLYAEVEAAGRAQVISIGVHSVLVGRELASCLAQFARAWPNIVVNVREGFSADLIERLSSGEVDFVCCALPAELDDAGSLAVGPRARLAYSVVARPTHPIFGEIARGEPIGAHAWIQFDVQRMGTFPSDEDIRVVLDRFGYSHAHRTVRTTSMNMIKEMVISEDYIGLIADSCVAGELAAGTLQRVPGSQIEATSFGIVGLKDDLDTKAMSALKDLMASRVLAPLAHGDQASHRHAA